MPKNITHHVEDKPRPLGMTRNKTLYKLFRKRTNRLQPFNADNTAPVKLFIIYFAGFVILYLHANCKPKDCDLNINI